MIKLAILLLAMYAACFVANAGAIDVTYTVSGSAGAWDMNFTVANNMAAWPTQDIYQFGVMLSGPGITGSPTGYDPSAIGSLTNLFLGGKPITYNNVWVDGTDFNHLMPGTSLAGFMVQVPDVNAPASVAWFAYSVANTGDPADIYTGTEAFSIDFNGLGSSGFEGVATAAAPTDVVGPAAVPEPSTLGSMIIALVAGLFLRRNVLRG